MNRIYEKNLGSVITFANEDYHIFKSKENSEKCILTCYPLFEGIELVYYDVHKQTCDIDLTMGRKLLQINHCQEGRIEFEYKNGEYLYLSKGDLSIQKRSDNIRSRYCPLNHYHGISVLIDMSKVPKCLSCVLEDVFVTPSELVKKFCTNKSYTVMRENKSIEHIFSELYSVPDNIRKGYLKVKVLELLLFLSGLELNDIEERKYYSHSQVTATKNAKDYLISHIDEQITIPELSEMFGISQTALKICFKGIYGDTIHTFISNYRVQIAARLLKTTDKSILEISGDVGYNNSSKFASVFKKVMGVSPNEYRKLDVALEHTLS
ncbi:MAG: AraC family transcriptional regulator [Ruminococcus sp.]|nr:AraC family transcriptional regulator [Ruminococcus sp.]